MNWSQYTKKFKIISKRAGNDKAYIERCLNYARPLFERNLPIIYDQEHLAQLVGYEYDYLLRVSNSCETFYRKFKIPKKRNGFRTIVEPLPSLKEIQRWILDNILYSCPVSRFAKGFVKDRSTKENARFHRGQKMVLTVDIKDFFGSIKAGKIYRFYENLGYCSSVTYLLTELCVYRRALPQGAPTSPALSNLIAFRIDARLSGYSLKHKIRYTRYADDLTFSGEFNCNSLIGFIRKVLADEKLVLNENKTRLMLPHRRQEVTGIVINKKIQSPREMRRKLRFEIYYIDKYGLDSHLAHAKITKTNYLQHLRGIAHYILFLNAKDNDALRALDVLRGY